MIDDDLVSLKETDALLRDPAARGRMKEAEQAIAEGDVFTPDKVRAMLAKRRAE